MDGEALARQLEAIRPELLGYLSRILLQSEAAEDIVQSTYLRASAAIASAPAGGASLRAWLFRIATNLAFDHLRRHSSWREISLTNARSAAEANADFMTASTHFFGTPESKTIAKEHLAFCFSCTLRQLPEQRAAALLLKEVYDFSVEETATILGTKPTQAKNWLQEGRAYMKQSYQSTCALVAKTGVCYQCVELDETFAANAGSPLAPRRDSFAQRIKVLQALKTSKLGPWHKLLVDLLEEI